MLETIEMYEVVLLPLHRKTTKVKQLYMTYSKEDAVRYATNFNKSAMSRTSQPFEVLAVSRLAMKHEVTAKQRELAERLAAPFDQFA